MQLKSNKIGSKLGRILLCFFVLGNIPEGFVVCYGADGHVALEAASHKSCLDCSHTTSEDHTQEEFIETADHSDHEHCHPCIDIPVSSGLYGVFSGSSQVKSVIFCAAISDFPATIKIENSEIKIPQPPPQRENQQLLSLSTVILLT